MKSQPWRRLDTFARQLSPFGLSLFMLLLGVIPLRVTGLEAIEPSLLLIAVYYWTLYRPDLMPAVAAFGLGLLHDMLSGSPVGVHAAQLVLVHAVVNTQRRFFHGKSFSVIWLGFVLIVIGSFALTWVMSSMFRGMLLPGSALAVQAVITAGCFPLITWLLQQWHVWLLMEPTHEP